jgi:hypothetical protein
LLFAELLALARFNRALFKDCVLETGAVAGPLSRLCAVALAMLLPGFVPVAVKLLSPLPRLRDWLNATLAPLRNRLLPSLHRLCCLPLLFGNLGLIFLPLKFPLGLFMKGWEYTAKAIVTGSGAVTGLAMQSDFEQ